MAQRHRVEPAHVAEFQGWTAALPRLVAPELHRRHRGVLPVRRAVVPVGLPVEERAVLP